jgi:hypothetical protein
MQERIVKRCCGEMKLQKQSYDVQYNLKDLAMVWVAYGWQKLGSRGFWIKHKEGV